MITKKQKVVKNKVLEVIKKAVEENGEYNLNYDEQTEDLFGYVERELDLSFCYYLRGDDGDYWTQIEYYSNKLKKTIVFDYDVGNYDDYDEMADAIIRLDEEIRDFENKISFNCS